MIDDSRPENERVASEPGKMKRKVADVAHAAVERARTEADARKGTAAGTIEKLATAVDSARDGLAESPTLSGYAGELSGSMHGLAERLRSRSIDEIVNDVRGLARRNPTIFIAGSIALGLLGARFLKASARREKNEDASAGMGMTPAPGIPDEMPDTDPPIQGVH